MVDRPDLLRVHPTKNPLNVEHLEDKIYVLHGNLREKHLLLIRERVREHDSVRTVDYTAMFYEKPELRFSNGKAWLTGYSSDVSVSKADLINIQKSHYDGISNPKLKRQLINAKENRRYHVDVFLIPDSIDFAYAKQEIAATLILTQLTHNYPPLKKIL